MQRKVKISLHFFLFCYIQFPKSNLKENRMYYPYSYRKGYGMQMQQEGTDRGSLQVTVLTEDGTRP